MKAAFKIVAIDEDRSELRLHPCHLNEISYQEETPIVFQFGTKTVEVRLIPSLALGKYEIEIPNMMVEQLTIPLMCRYELMLKENRLTLGPFIGILAEPTEAKLMKKLYQSKYTLSNYMVDYDRIGGAIVVFSLECVNPQTQTVRGFVFHPEEGRWEQGIFQYPAAVFNRISLSPRWRRHFQAVAKSYIFNSCSLNKWRMHSWLSMDPRLRCFIPNTVLYQNLEQIYDFMKRHREIYIKPIRGSLGRKIIKVIRQEDGLRIRFSSEAGEDSIDLDPATPEAAVHFFENNLAPGAFIVQQAVDLLSMDEKLIDFRVIVLKNYNGLWEDMGLISRHGKEGSIVTNILSGGTAHMGERTIQNVLNISDEEAGFIRQQMTDIAMRTAGWLDQHGEHYGNLGIDMAVDWNRKIWIIEVNSRNPDHSIALNAGNHEMYRRCMLANMLYAKRLSGFMGEA